jgi:RimJ/RimL family protein N-acetyltransferase
MVLGLPDGRRTRIRPIAPGDKALLQEGLQRLSPDSVRRRFLGPKPRLSAAELRYLTEVDGRDHIALVAVDDEDRERLIGVARCVRCKDDAGTAEMAIVVADAWQGHGVGHFLAEALAHAAAEVGVRRFSAVILADNVGAQRLLGGITDGLRLGVASSGVRELVGELRP